MHTMPAQSTKNQNLCARNIELLALFLTINNTILIMVLLNFINLLIYFVMLILKCSIEDSNTLYSNFQFLPSSLPRLAFLLLALFWVAALLGFAFFFVLIPSDSYILTFSRFGAILFLV